jgi:NADPH:quinone reductase-like Zn-dependent oxidoreductase
MKAIQITSTGGPEVLEYCTVPDPVPNRNKVLIQVHTSGVNFIDVYFRDGHYKAPLPLIPGGEGSGYIAALGTDVSGFEVGDPVAWFGPLGSYAQRAVVLADRIVRVPSGMDMGTAAALMVPTLEKLTAVIDAVFEMYATETLEALIGPSYALKDAAEAHRDLEIRKSTGKLLLSVGG